MDETTGNSDLADGADGSGDAKAFFGSGVRSVATWRPRNRTVRIVLLLAFLWMVGLADLRLTLLAAQLGDFAEGNPLAAPFMHRPDVLVVFKVTALFLASAIFIVLRRHRFAEAACWVMCVVYAGLALLWRLYFYGIV
jgi:hypothetical protein